MGTSSRWPNGEIAQGRRRLGAWTSDAHANDDPLNKLPTRCAAGSAAGDDEILAGERHLSADVKSYL
jgi:hypothetical protein